MEWKRHGWLQNHSAWSKTIDEAINHEINILEELFVSWCTCLLILSGERTICTMTMRGYIHEERVNNWNKELPLAFQT
jgi:hypothetical protein